MTTMRFDPKTLDADDVSRILADYLSIIGHTESGVVTADHAIEQILESEAEELAELAGTDDVYPTLLLGYGVAFGISATSAVLSAPPQDGLDRVTKLVAKLQADMRDLVDNARKKGRADG